MIKQRKKSPASSKNSSRNKDQRQRRRIRKPKPSSVQADTSLLPAIRNHSFLFSLQTQLNQLLARSMQKVSPQSFANLHMHATHLQKSVVLVVDKRKKAVAIGRHRGKLDKIVALLRVFVMLHLFNVQIIRQMVRDVVKILWPEASLEASVHSQAFAYEFY